MTDKTIYVHVKRKGQGWAVELEAADDLDLRTKLVALYSDAKAGEIEGVDITDRWGGEYRRQR